MEQNQQAKCQLGHLAKSEDEEDIVGMLLSDSPALLNLKYGVGPVHLEISEV